MSESEFVLVYATYPDGDTARTAAQMLVGEKLIACANILAPGQSVYVWQGAIETAGEVVVLMKTRRVLADAAISRAKGLHPYAIPCFLVLPIDGGDPAFLEWVRGQTR